MEAAAAELASAETAATGGGTNILRRIVRTTRDLDLQGALGSRSAWPSEANAKAAQDEERRVKLLRAKFPGKPLKHAR